MKQLKRRTTVHMTDFGDEILAETEEFDPEGQLIHSVKYFESGTVESESYFEYENEKLIVEKNFNEYGGENKTDYVYDIDGELRYKRMTYADGTTEQEKRILEPGTEIIENYDGSDQMYKKQVLLYDSGNKLNRVEFFENEKLVEINLYKHNTRGEMTGRTVHDLVQNKKYFYRLEYDSAGNQVLTELKNENGDLLLREFSVYDSGRLAELHEENFLDGNIRQITKYEYDEKGNLLRETSFSWSGKIKSDKVFQLNENGDAVLSTMVETGHFDAVFGTGNFGRNLKTRYELEYF